MNELLKRITDNPRPPKPIIIQSLDQLAKQYSKYRKQIQHMITFKELYEKGFRIETNTTGAIIVDMIDTDDVPIDNLFDVSYTQKEIIYDDTEQTYDLIDTRTDSTIFSTDNYEKLITKIEELVK